jgi:hypothetical protein
MKVIISHDVDHITTWEHKCDLIIPKLLLRSLIELGSGYISSTEIVSRLKMIIFNNKYNNLKEIMVFNKENRIPSTYFIGVSKGNGLNYSINDARYWIKRVVNEGFAVGVHGISYDNFSDIKREYESFKSIVGTEKFGIRMHYLKQDHSTFETLNIANYLYDCTNTEMRNPFKIGKLWEFPLHLMDINVMYKNSRRQNQTLRESQDTTKRIIEEGYEAGLKYFSILYHDRFFCDGFKTWKEWYIWLIKYLKENRFKFINYDEAVIELENLPENR